MTVITQYRLKCDFCGNVSPVTRYSEINEHGTPQARVIVLPPGWQEWEMREQAQMFKAYDMIEYDSGTNKQTLVPMPVLHIGVTVYHACTPAHKEAWEKQQAEQTA